MSAEVVARLRAAGIRVTPGNGETFMPVRIPGLEQVMRETRYCADPTTTLDEDDPAEDVPPEEGEEQ